MVGQVHGGTAIHAHDEHVGLLVRNRRVGDSVPPGRGRAGPTYPRVAGQRLLIEGVEVDDEHPPAALGALSEEHGPLARGPAMRLAGSRGDLLWLALDRAHDEHGAPFGERHHPTRGRPHRPEHPVCPRSGDLHDRLLLPPIRGHDPKRRLVASSGGKGDHLSVGRPFREHVVPLDVGQLLPLAPIQLGDVDQRGSARLQGRHERHPTPVRRP